MDVDKLRNRADGWYVSRELHHENKIMRVEGESPWNQYVLDRGPIGEHARFMLEMEVKRHGGTGLIWPWWSPSPRSCVTTTRMYDAPAPPPLIEPVAGWLMTAFAILKAL